MYIRQLVCRYTHLSIIWSKCRVFACSRTIVHYCVLFYQSKQSCSARKRGGVHGSRRVVAVQSSSTIPGQPTNHSRWPGTHCSAPGQDTGAPFAAVDAYARLHGVHVVGDRWLHRPVWCRDFLLADGILRSRLAGRSAGTAATSTGCLQTDTIRCSTPSRVLGWKRILLLVRPAASLCSYVSISF